MAVSIKEHGKFSGTQEEIEIKRLLNAVLNDLADLRATIVANKALYDAHTHRLPATPVEDENTSAPDTTAATGAKAPGAASAFTTPSALTLVE